jgi:hypothetical protein
MYYNKNQLQIRYIPSLRMQSLIVITTEKNRNLFGANGATQIILNELKANIHSGDTLAACCAALRNMAYDCSKFSTLSIGKLNFGE